jgi:hypothetical protein
MTFEKREELQLLTWFLIIIGPALAIPGTLVFGLIEYLCGYLAISAFLLVSALVVGNVTDTGSSSGTTV